MKDVESLMSSPTSYRSRLSVQNDPTQQSFPSTAPTAYKNWQRKLKTNVDEQADEILSIARESLRNNNNNSDDTLNIFGKTEKWLIVWSGNYQYC